MKEYFQNGLKKKKRVFQLKFAVVDLYKNTTIFSNNSKIHYHFTTVENEG